MTHLIRVKRLTKIFRVLFAHGHKVIRRFGFLFPFFYPVSLYSESVLIDGNRYSYSDTGTLSFTESGFLYYEHIAPNYTYWQKSYCPYGSISYYASNSSTIEVPSSITISGHTYPVKHVSIYGISGINEVKFSDGIEVVDIGSVSGIRELTIPDSVLYLRVNGCANLEKVNLPSNLKVYAGYHGHSLYGAPLKEINFPASLVEIGVGALRGSKFKTLSVPSTVRCVGGAAFQSCTDLTNAIFNASCLLDSEVFAGCTALKNIIIGDSVTGICVGHWNGQVYSPLQGCTALAYVSLGQRITGVLPKRLFDGLKSLQRITCNGTITGIGEYAFNNCTSLIEFENAGVITSIQQGGLYNCQKLSNFSFDTSKCKTFGANACSRCYAFNDTLDLTSATSVGNSAFSECTNIKELDYRNKMTTMPQYAFSSCTSLTNVLLSANLKSIGNYAFYRCSKLNNVIVPENVTYIGTNAFQSCSSLKKVFFNGKPPSATSAFTSIASNAHGYYRSRYKSEWQSVIDSNGKWNGLIMEEQVAPVLDVSGASIPYDTLTLKWTYTSNDAVKYSLYRNTENNFSSASLVATGAEIAGGEYIESAFMGITPQTAPLHYWIVAENQTTGETTSDHVEARRRFLLSVGYSAYANGNTAYVQSYRDASLFRSSCTSRGGFQTENTVLASNATTKKIREHMKDFASRTQPGDLFVFYIATHGGDYDVPVVGDKIKELDIFDLFEVNTSSLVTYDNEYLVAALQTDIRRFSSGVAVCAIIMSCHSKSLAGTMSGRNWVDNWLANCGFGQCLGNVAWITSCDSSQNSYNSSSYTMFGQAFIRDGFNRGCADGELFGTSYAGGNNDKLITFKELGSYAREFAQGLSDDKPAEVQMENPDLLARIVAGNKTSNYYFLRPNPPCNIVADQGKFVGKISVGWDVVDDATEYRIYRTPVKQGSTRKWIGRNVGYSNTSFDDDSITLLRTEYNYQIQAVNPVGFSELSTSVSGWRGTPYYLSLIDSYYHQLTGASVDVDSVSYSDKENATAMNGYSLGASYIAGLDPTNETSKFTAKITISNGVPFIVWTPDLGSSRTYTIYGKTDLTDANWTSPTNSSHRFFKVGVELPE